MGRATGRISCKVASRRSSTYVRYSSMNIRSVRKASARTATENNDVGVVS